LSSWTIIAIVAFTVSCSSSKELVDDSHTYDLGKQIVNSARSEIGSKYKYASRGPKSFDCSGLVEYVYDQHDINVSGSAAAMSSLGRSVNIEDAQPGDLVFYKKGGRVFHVSIISEVNAREIHVVHSTSSRGVIEEDIRSSTYWSNKIYKVISLASLKH